jgi:MSHA biogenesis protein MshN
MEPTLLEPTSRLRQIKRVQQRFSELSLQATTLQVEPPPPSPPPPHAATTPPWLGLVCFGTVGFVAVVLAASLASHQNELSALAAVSYASDTPHAILTASPQQATATPSAVATASPAPPLAEPLPSAEPTTDNPPASPAKSEQAEVAENRPAPTPVRAWDESPKWEAPAAGVPPSAQRPDAPTAAQRVAVPSTAQRAVAPSPAPPAQRAVIEKTPPGSQQGNRIDAAFRKASTDAAQGRVAEAQNLLRAILRTDSRHIASRQLLVRLLIKEKRVDEAIQVLQEGLKGQPALTGWAMTLARLQVDRNDLTGASQTLRNSMSAATGNSDYLGFAGHVQHRLGHSKEAADLYLAAARLVPNDGRWWLGLGLAMESEGHNDQAHSAFLRAQKCKNLSQELAMFVEQKVQQYE